MGLTTPALVGEDGGLIAGHAGRADRGADRFLFYGICGGTSKPAFKDERARVTAAIFWMKTRGAPERNQHPQTHRDGER